MDKELRAEIVREVRRAMVDAFELYQERWVDGRELCKEIGCFSTDWLRRYGYTLPREQVIVNENDTTHKTGWCYPLHRIQRMMREGNLKNIII